MGRDDYCVTMGRDEVSPIFWVDECLSRGGCFEHVWFSIVSWSTKQAPAAFTLCLDYVLQNTMLEEGYGVYSCGMVFGLDALRMLIFYRLLILRFVWKQFFGHLKHFPGPVRIRSYAPLMKC